MLSPIVALFDQLLFSKIRDGFGGCLAFFIGGGALLDIELQRFFYAIGIPMYKGYGLSEASPVISSNTPDQHKLGTSGKVVQDLQIRILDEDGNECPVGSKGEIVVKGKNGFEITFDKVGSFPTPINIIVTYEDGSQDEINESAALWKEGGEYVKITLDSRVAVKKVEINRLTVPDVDDGNDGFEVE